MATKRNKQYDTARLTKTLDEPTECDGCGAPITEGWTNRTSGKVVCAACIENILTRQAREAKEKGKPAPPPLPGATSEAEPPAAPVRGRK